MTYSIALAGKGGTGKTTMAGMLVKYLVEKGRTPVLAVDADANANLNEVLGLKVEETLGDAREQMKTGASSGMTKDIFMEMKLQEAVVEAEGFDLIVMGRPEGAGCYCAANTLLTQSLEKLIQNYTSIVMDNEAGMEHISRQTTRRIDRLFVLTDPTQRGLAAAEHIMILARDLNTRIGSAHLVINNVAGDLPEPLATRAREVGIPLLGVLPRDPAVGQFDVLGRPLVELDDASLVYPAVKALLARALSS